MKNLLISFMVLSAFICNAAYATDIQEIKKLLASDGEADDRFGRSVSISDDHAIVGAYGEDSNGHNAGVAYLFYKDFGGIGNWGIAKKLTANDAEAGDVFGRSVSISGDYAIVGATGHDSLFNNSGAAYIFKKNLGSLNNWEQLTILIANDAEANDAFGSSLSISGDYVIVGAPAEDTDRRNAGAAYIFKKNKGGLNNWGQVAKLTASDAEEGASFGTSVSISGDYVIVGAASDDSWGGNAGVAYIFFKDQDGVDNWGQVKKIFSRDAEANDNFGLSVSISGDYAIVGAWGEDYYGNESGAAYIFHKNHEGEGNWGQIKKITASNAQIDDRFGGYVSISGNYATVGAIMKDILNPDTGAAYLFHKNHGGEGNWGEVGIFTASDAQTYDHFGISVSISFEFAIVGAWQETSGGFNAGAAYIYQFIPSGIEETPERTDVVIYPEVADDIITIEYNGIYNYLQASIYSLEGNLLIGQTLNGEKNTISIANLAPGTYFVHVDTPNVPVVRKFVKR